MLKTLMVASGLVCVGTSVGAATLAELQRYDKNRNGRIDPGAEVDVYILHQLNPILMRHDANTDGRLDAQELKKLQSEMGVSADRSALAKAGRLQDEAGRKGGIPLADLAQTGAPTPTSCDSGQGLYVRRDKLDIAAYTPNVSQSALQGAAVSYTDDRISDTQIAQIQGVVSYVVARNPCVKRVKGEKPQKLFVSGYAVAPFVAANGQLSSNRATEKSALKPGVDFQVELFSGWLFDTQYFTGSPFYQTDFRGQASAYGFTGSWEPYQLDWRLGGSYQQFSPYLDFYWQFKADATFLHVDRAGLTDLAADADYAWLGSQARLNIFPFAELLAYRLSLILAYQHYWDERSGRDVSLGSAAIAYNLDETGFTSVSLEYRRGTERDTLERVEKYLVNLNFKH